MADTELFRQILAIAIVFGLLAAAVRFLGRRTGAMRLLMTSRSGAISHLHVVERHRITPQHTVVLLRIGRRGMLVAVHPGGCSLLDSRPLAELVEREEDR